MEAIMRRKITFFTLLLMLSVSIYAVSANGSATFENSLTQFVGGSAEMSGGTFTNQSFTGSPVVGEMTGATFESEGSFADVIDAIINSVPTAVSTIQQSVEASSTSQVTLLLLVWVVLQSAVMWLLFRRRQAQSTTS